MFLSIVTYNDNRKRLINVNEIREVAPGRYADQTIVTLQTGVSVEWRMSFDHAQEILIDNAAQVTAPIASRVMGLDNTLARLCRSVEDLLERTEPKPLITTDISQELDPDTARIWEAYLSHHTRAPFQVMRAQPTLESVLQKIDGTLSGLRERLEPEPKAAASYDVVLEDVANVSRLLEDREWADHCTSTAIGKRLELAVTTLHNEYSKGRDRLRDAEALLAVVWHAWNNDPGVRDHLGYCIGQNIGNFLFPGQNNTCEKE